LGPIRVTDLALAVVNNPAQPPAAARVRHSPLQEINVVLVAAFDSSKKAGFRSA